MSDGWTNSRSKPTTNFFVSSPGLTIFIKSVDISTIYKSGEKLYKRTDTTFQKIEEENVT